MSLNTVLAALVLASVAFAALTHLWLVLVRRAVRKMDES